MPTARSIRPNMPDAIKSRWQTSQPDSDNAARAVNGADKDHQTRDSVTGRQLPQTGTTRQTTGANTGRTGRAAIWSRNMKRGSDPLTAPFGIPDSHHPS
ncbi:hypothetical protein MACH17_27570 [Phaeobacter inhibens]|nr:hypothetical protein MACH17_27570 [Phaeobacter inhibens]